MTRTVEIEFGWANRPGPSALCRALLDRYALRRHGEVIQSLEITGIEPEHVEWVRVVASHGNRGYFTWFETTAQNGGNYLAWLAENMGLGKRMVMQFHAPGSRLAPGAAVEWHEYLHVDVQLTYKAPKDAPMRLEITLDKPPRMPEPSAPFKCHY